jgi:hemolysin III
MSLPEPLKPRWRGVLHQYAFFVAVVAGAALVLAAEGGRARTGAVVYAIGLTGLLGTSALYHRLDWPPRARMWMRRIDHSMIFVLIAGTVTPIALIALEGSLQTVLLVMVWAGAAFGVALSLLWPRAPKWLTALVYVALGWSGIVALPELAGYAVPALVLLAAGGILYTAGAVIYALGRPDPAPRVFGYHEVFHALVVIAAALHYAAVGIVVL